jgi:pimeloyl-ACP methyl ester carboxylesterase
VIPLLLLHGWPSSVHDFFEIIKPLAHPGDAETIAFDVVVPSQTGYLWSSAPKVDKFGMGNHSGPQGDFLLQGESNRDFIQLID